MYSFTFSCDSSHYVGNQRGLEELLVACVGQSRKKAGQGERHSELGMSVWDEKRSCWTLLATLGRTLLQRSPDYSDVSGMQVCLVLGTGRQSVLQAHLSPCQHGQATGLMGSATALSLGSLVWTAGPGPSCGLHTGWEYGEGRADFALSILYLLDGAFLISESLFSRKVAACFCVRAEDASSLRKLRSCSSLVNNHDLFPQW